MLCVVLVILLIESAKGDKHDCDNWPELDAYGQPYGDDPHAISEWMELVERCRREPIVQEEPESDDEILEPIHVELAGYNVHCPDSEIGEVKWDRPYPPYDVKFTVDGGEPPSPIYKYDPSNGEKQYVTMYWPERPSEGRRIDTWEPIDVSPKTEVYRPERDDAALPERLWWPTRESHGDEIKDHLQWMADSYERDWAPLEHPIDDDDDECEGYSACPEDGWHTDASGIHAYYKYPVIESADGAECAYWPERHSGDAFDEEARRAFWKAHHELYGKKVEPMGVPKKVHVFYCDPSSEDAESVGCHEHVIDPPPTQRFEDIVISPFDVDEDDTLELDDGDDTHIKKAHEFEYDYTWDESAYKGWLDDDSYEIKLLFNDADVIHKYPAEIREQDTDEYISVNGHVRKMASTSPRIDDADTVRANRRAVIKRIFSEAFLPMINLLGDNTIRVNILSDDILTDDKILYTPDMKINGFRVRAADEDVLFTVIENLYLVVHHVMQKPCYDEVLRELLNE